MTTETRASVCDRFAAVGPDAALTIDSFHADTGDGPEPWIRLNVDGAPFVALPRQDFLTAFHCAIHDLHDDPESAA